MTPHAHGSRFNKLSILIRIGLIYFRMMASNTIEERIKQLQDYKLGLSEEVLTGSCAKKSTKLSLADMKQLFDM